MHLGPTLIADSFAEAFSMRYLRLIVTAEDDYWLRAAVQEASGYGTSIIACDAEIGLEQLLSPPETPDGRPGAALLAFGITAASLGQAVANRAGQCLMTCPTTAVYDGLPHAGERVPLGRRLRYFGDGYQKSKLLTGRRYWRIPVMDGEFLVEDTLGVTKGVAGGNIILEATAQTPGLAAARRAIENLSRLRGVITPFPGGVARSGSKVGSRYKTLRASTAESYCPSLRGRVDSQLHADANCAYEIVIDGVDEQAVAGAMAAAMRAAAGDGVVRITAGNYGGKLGKYQFRLRELLSTA